MIAQSFLTIAVGGTSASAVSEGLAVSPVAVGADLVYRIGAVEAALGEVGKRGAGDQRGAQVRDQRDAQIGLDRATAGVDPADGRVGGSGAQPDPVDRVLRPDGRARPGGDPGVAKTPVRWSGSMSWSTS
ncbi:hypothetical protein [Frankia sp. KB5]|uniref:hypothetical protein n=1 Tax=Frankia sp. KB5 TaxID=683318 RepID=UPI001056B30C|nr:hypothetical protein [Frankia sp. KB5]